MNLPACPRAVGLVTAATIIALLPRHAIAQPSGNVMLRQMYGDMAIEVWRAPDAMLRIGAADARRAVAINVLARDLSRWVDSATRILALRSAGRAREARWQAVVEAPGISGGAMA